MIMCFRTNKIVFCSGIGMLMLVYLAASNFEKYHKVAILGKQNTITQEADLHIDPVTGDLYSVNHEARSLEIKGNIGLHFRKAAQEYQMMGKFVMQAPVYHPPKIKELQGIYFNSQNELICYIKKTQLHHWGFRDVPMEFKVETNNTWDIHQFSYTNSKRQFAVLADGERGPLIIEC